MKRLPWCAPSIALLFCLLVFAAAPGEGADLDVCRLGCTYTTVQQAVEAAHSGDRIRIASSSIPYQGPIVLTGVQDLTLEGGWEAGQWTQVDDPAATVLQGGTPVVAAQTSGVSTITLRNLTIRGGGSGIQIRPISGDLSVILEGLIIRDNSGGGVEVFPTQQADTSVSIEASNLWITGNAGGGAGGVRLYGGAEGPAVGASFTNCTIVENVGGDGGGLSLYSTGRGGPTVTATNCIIWDNTRRVWQEGHWVCEPCDDCYPPVCTFVPGEPRWRSGDVFADTGAMLTLDHCDVNSVQAAEGSELRQRSVLRADPRLTDFRLQSNSPCIDQGRADTHPSSDLEGDPRPLGTAVDIGADEFWSCDLDQTGPGPVSDLTAQTPPGTAVLSWLPPSDQDLTALSLYRKGPGDAEPALVARLSGTATSYTFEDLTPSVSYTLRLVPEDLCGNLGTPAEIQVTVTEPPEPCDLDRTGPGPVSDLTAQTPPGTAVLSWLPPSDQDLTALSLYRKGPGDAEPALVARLSGTATSYTFEDLTPSVSYTLRLVPEDLCGNLGTPAEIQVTVTDYWYVYVPYIRTDEGWGTEIRLINGNDQAIEVRIEVFSSDGSRVSEEESLLPARGAADIPGVTGAAAIVRTTGAAAAYVHVHGPNGSAWYPAALGTEGQLFVPDIESDEHWKTGIALFNPSEASAEVTITADSGESLSMTLPPFGQTAGELPEILEEAGISPDGVHSAVITSSGGTLTGVSSVEARDWPGSDLAVMPLGGELANVIYLPEVGDGVTSWTGAALQAPEGLMTSVRIQPFSTAGPQGPVEWTASGEGVRQMAFNISAWLEASGAQWARMEANSLTGSGLAWGILYSTVGGFDMVNAAGLLFNDAAVPVDGDSPFLVVVNPWGEQVSCVFTAYDWDGHILDAGTIGLPPYGKEITDLYGRFGPFVAHVAVQTPRSLIGIVRATEGDYVVMSPLLAVPRRP